MKRTVVFLIAALFATSQPLCKCEDDRGRATGTPGRLEHRSLLTERPNHRTRWETQSGSTVRQPY